jgi:hypothetical protein
MSNQTSIKLQEKAISALVVTSDFAGFSGDEIKAYQKYVRAHSDWSAVRDYEKLSPESIAKIEKNATKWRATFDQMRSKELKSGIKTPYRKNYIPQYRRDYNLFSIFKRKHKPDGPLSDWWFTKEQDPGLQTKQNFIKSHAARDYFSKLARKDLPVLRDLVAGRKDIAHNLDRIQNVNSYIKPTRWEKAMKPFGAVNNFWKKSVLLGRPAWYVNNELFNQMQGITYGGFQFLKNQRGTQKYLSHISKNAKSRLLPSEAHKVVTSIASSLSHETNGGRFMRFASKQEDRSRVALYRTFRQRGLSHDDAVKHLDKALFSYQTKNWERPIKAVVPFWHFQKNAAQAAARMPFEKPTAAVAYNRLDRFQQQQYDRDFNTVIPELKKLGYSDQDIASIREDNAKYFRGRLKIGNRYFTTPFNAFSEKGLASFGLNPFLAAGREVATSTNSFKQDTSGSEAGWWRRISSKFPQWELGRQFKRSFDVSSGSLKPQINYIGKAGHDDFGLGKTKQGFDPSKSNYVASLDPRKNLAKNAASFAGVPSSLDFDKSSLVKSKTLQKLTADYFKLDTSKMDFKSAEAARTALFKKYGVSSDDFYNGILSKYDSDNTKNIKQLKQTAADKNKSLFNEYGRQPQGSRNIWVTQKMHDLNKSGYFNDNPYLKGFQYVSPTSIAKANKQLVVQKAIKSGDWSEYRAKFGVPGKSAKALARDKAVASGDWTEYAKKFGVTRKQSPFKYGDKFFKSAESMQAYKDGEFWHKYATASKSGKQTLLADNPQYNSRANWTAAMWQEQRRKDKAALRSKVNSWGALDSLIARNKDDIKKHAIKFAGTKNKRPYKIVYRG